MWFYHWCEAINKLLKKKNFWAYYICFVVYSGSAQALPHAP